MHVPDLAKDFILKYHTKKGDSFSFEELTKCMFEIRETFPHRIACFRLFGSMAKSVSVDSKTDDDYIEETKEETHPHGSIKIYLAIYTNSEGNWG